jgi:hypothetical protein
MFSKSFFNSSPASGLRLGGSNRVGKVALAAVALVAVAIGVKFAFLDQSRYLVPGQTVPQGASLATVSWSEVSANLGAIGGEYLPAGSVPRGFAARDLMAGQLVPSAAVSQVSAQEFSRVVVTSKTQLSQNVVAGARVTVWAAKRVLNTYEPPKLLVGSAKVAQVVKATGVVARQNQQVELLVNPLEEPAVLDARAGDSAIFLVARQ